ncbi:MAG: 50S ribosomal protein L3 [Minisyncoccales bacterium]
MKKKIKKFILGKKIGMSQYFQEDGQLVPVTLVKAGPCFVTQIKTKEKDGYQAVQVGFEKIEKEKKIKKPLLKKPYKFLREFITEDVSSFKEGDKIDVSIFQKGEKVIVSGISKGKGFAGVVKRWGFKGRPSTHGTKKEERAPGAIGAASPHRVIPGKKMAGRLGGERITIKSLEIVQIVPEENLLLIKGSLPGPKNSLLEIKTK